ncbi:hypothetical protein BC567DRAFT_224160 [Phyllosticta citribraziliensis]
MASLLLWWRRAVESGLQTLQRSVITPPCRRHARLRSGAERKAVGRSIWMLKVNWRRVLLARILFTCPDSC